MPYAKRRKSSSTPISTPSKMAKQNKSQRNQLTQFLSNIKSPKMILEEENIYFGLLNQVAYINMSDAIINPYDYMNAKKSSEQSNANYSKSSKKIPMEESDSDNDSEATTSMKKKSNKDSWTNGDFQMTSPIKSSRIKHNDASVRRSPRKNKEKPMKKHPIRSRIIVVVDSSDSEVEVDVFQTNKKENRQNKNKKLENAEDTESESQEHLDEDVELNETQDEKSEESIKKQKKVVQVQEESDTEEIIMQVQRSPSQRTKRKPKKFTDLEESTSKQKKARSSQKKQVGVTEDEVIVLVYNENEGDDIEESASENTATSQDNLNLNHPENDVTNKEQSNLTEELTNTDSETLKVSESTEDSINNEKPKQSLKDDGDESSRTQEGTDTTEIIEDNAPNIIAKYSKILENTDCSSEDLSIPNKKSRKCHSESENESEEESCNKKKKKRKLSCDNDTEDEKTNDKDPERDDEDDNPNGTNGKSDSDSNNTDATAQNDPDITEGDDVSNENGSEQPLNSTQDLINILTGKDNDPNVEQIETSKKITAETVTLLHNICEVSSDTSIEKEKKSRLSLKKTTKLGHQEKENINSTSESSDNDTKRNNKKRISFKLSFKPSFDYNKYNCDTCNKIFSRKCDLVLHNLKHVDKRSLSVRVYRSILPYKYDTSVNDIDKYLKPKKKRVVKETDVDEVKSLISKYCNEQFLVPFDEILDGDVSSSDVNLNQSTENEDQNITVLSDILITSGRDVGIDEGQLESVSTVLEIDDDGEVQSELQDVEEKREDLQENNDSDKEISQPMDGGQENIDSEKSAEELIHLVDGVEEAQSSKQDILDNTDLEQDYQGQKDLLEHAPENADFKKNDNERIELDKDSEEILDLHKDVDEVPKRHQDNLNIDSEPNTQKVDSDEDVAEINIQQIPNAQEIKEKITSTKEVDISHLEKNLATKQSQQTPLRNDIQEIIDSDEESAVTKSQVENLYSFDEFAENNGTNLSDNESDATQIVESNGICGEESDNHKENKASATDEGSNKRRRSLEEHDEKTANKKRKLQETAFITDDGEAEDFHSCIDIASPARSEEIIACNISDDCEDIDLALTDLDNLEDHKKLDSTLTDLKPPPKESMNNSQEINDGLKSPSKSSITSELDTEEYIMQMAKLDQHLESIIMKQTEVEKHAEVLDDTLIEETVCQTSSGSKADGEEKTVQDEIKVSSSLSTSTLRI